MRVMFRCAACAGEHHCDVQSFSLSHPSNHSNSCPVVSGAVSTQSRCSDAEAFTHLCSDCWTQPGIHLGVFYS